MGKEAGDQRQRPPDGGAGGGGAEGSRRCGYGGAVRLQCVAALVLGAAVLLSALFWLPPFAGRAGRGPPAATDPFAITDDIVASFRLQKNVSELRGNMSKLVLDIYAEVGVPNSIVAVDLLHPLAGSNWTNVIFSIVPYPKNLTISSMGLSIIRSSFMSLVVRQSTLHLTKSLFGNSSSFEVLKFPGGITIIPPQHAFPPETLHATFNFTLNFPIYKVQDRTDELKDQMKKGLLLNSNENLYFKLGNLQGSTILPPTIVETYIVRVVGNHQPSVPRMKQLAQTITNSSKGNLGLNHTVFGRVKQISLSSYLNRSLHSRGSSDAPSQAPMQHHGHHGHHHHHHGHESNRHLAPAPIPIHTPRYVAPPPSGCPYKAKNRVPVTPAAEPVANDHRSTHPAASPPHPLSPSSVHHPPRDPNMHSRSPVPSPPVLPEPPLPTVSFSHAHPPSERATGAGPSAGMSLAPAPHSSNASRRLSCQWVLVPLIYTLLWSLL
ncbi:uncharacterized protein LOC125545964 [Triticum urartu]|uniref:DUF7036 domain-containing protein n=1 Tax=Triticum urartu TaxID=4572 RepID=A0A8R7U1W6_TRIUA|nr:uncharacterized protein LOC125545962 [Triticum urartu]XP_048565987.1 uncharacterized protein LOC125545964 [Triticum urartu]